MKNFIVLAVFFLATLIICGISGSLAKAEAGEMSATQTGADMQSEPEAQPKPMRSLCAHLWNSYYEEQNVEIRVSTKGEYDETVVFSCPNCSLEEHFVNPFLNSAYQGKSGITRIKECGFTKAVFKGARGLQEIERPIP